MFSLFLLGFAAPASAAELKDTSGEPVEVGGEMTLTSANLVSTFTGGNTTGCLNIVVQAEVAENGPEQVAIAPVSFSYSGCLLKPFNVAMFISNPNFGTITLSEGEGSASFKSTESVPAAALTCTYGGTFGFTYAAETSTLAIPGSPFTKSGGSAECPETKEMNGSFSMKNGLGAVTIN